MNGFQGVRWTVVLMTAALLCAGCGDARNGQRSKSVG